MFDLYTVLLTCNYNNNSNIINYINQLILLKPLSILIIYNNIDLKNIIINHFKNYKYFCFIYQNNYISNSLDLYKSTKYLKFNKYVLILNCNIPFIEYNTLFKYLNNFKNNNFIPFISNGIYIIRLNTKDKVYCKKIIINKR